MTKLAQAQQDADARAKEQVTAAMYKKKAAQLKLSLDRADKERERVSEEVLRAQGSIRVGDLSSIALALGVSPAQQGPIQSQVERLDVAGLALHVRSMNESETFASYADLFAKRLIDGPIFAQLTDEDLEKEFGIRQVPPHEAAARQSLALLAACSTLPESVGVSIYLA